MPDKIKEMLGINYYGCSDIGLVRIENQDSYGKFPQNDFDLYTEKGQLFIVADGMGGHVGGKEASSTAVETISRVYLESTSPDKLQILKNSFDKANLAIYGKSTSSDQYKRMGTTCSLLLLRGEQGYFAHVGDSRIYRIENNKIEQITEDHTKVREMLKNGLLTPKEAENYPSKSVLARAMGVEETVKADFRDDLTVRKGQSYILCSDGLAKVSKEEILEIVGENSPKDSCDKLIALANERGGKDNVTVLVIKITAQKSEPDSKPTKKRKFPFLKTFLVITVLVLIALGFQFRKRIAKVFDFNSPNKVNTENSSVSKKPVEEKPNYAGTNYGMLIQADKLYKKGDLESALRLYKKILYNEPMHLGALQGVNNIASDYMNMAEKLREKNDYSDALVFYKRVREIQPSNERVQKLIEECQIHINNNTADTSSASGK